MLSRNQTLDANEGLQASKLCGKKDWHVCLPIEHGYAYASLCLVKDLDISMLDSGSSISQRASTCAPGGSSCLGLSNTHRRLAELLQQVPLTKYWVARAFRLCTWSCSLDMAASLRSCTVRGRYAAPTRLDAKGRQRRAYVSPACIKFSYRPLSYNHIAGINLMRRSQVACRWYLSHLKVALRPWQSPWPPLGFSL